MEQGEAAAAEYVNLQLAVTYVVAVGDLVAYVDDKKQQDGFRDEYGVSFQHVPYQIKRRYGSRYRCHTNMYADVAQRRRNSICHHLHFYMLLL